MKKGEFKERLKYHFDNIMSKGTVAMMIVLAMVALLLVVLITVIIQAFGWNEEGGFFYTLWNVLSTTINAWMPSSEDGGVGYVALVAISAIIGVFFTSFLIGIISSAVEDKLSSLRAGNSKVVEEGHIVILGFKPGAYTLLEQIILSLGDRKRRIVIAEDEEKEKLETLIADNVEIPKNVRIICRNTDITDPVALGCCSMEKASLIIVNPINDIRTVKTLLAVSTAFEGHQGAKPRIVSTVELDEYTIPHAIREKYGFTMLRTNNAVARIIAHSCTQPGLSAAFSEVFDFEGNEFRVEQIGVPAGTRFKDIVYSMQDGVPVGIIRDGRTLLNPPRDTDILDTDMFIVLEEKEGDCSISEERMIDILTREASELKPMPQRKEKVLIIGSNNKLKVVLNELPSYVEEVLLLGTRHLESKSEICNESTTDIKLTMITEDERKPGVLERLALSAKHVIILSDYALDEETSDGRNIMLLLQLRDIKERNNASFTITSEMRRDDNRNLISCGDTTEFIVSSNMSAMVLTQIAVTPLLYDTFHELLSNGGNEFQIRNASFVEECVGVERTIADIRRALLHRNALLLGIIERKDDKDITCLNPDVSGVVVLNPEAKLIVISRL